MPSAPTEELLVEPVEKAAGQAVEKAKEAKQSLLQLFQELDEWRKDNHYITSGYRSPSNSWAKSWASLAYLHNESVNIYTHLIGAIVFAVGSVPVYSVLSSRYEQADWHDVYVFACFFLGAVGCLGMSATYHTISNHSRSVAVFGNQLDYLGIVSLIWGSFIPSIYYGFTCQPKLITTYWAMITTIGAGCAVVSVDSRFRTPRYRPFRAGMFVAMGLSAVFPVIHGVTLHGLEKMTKLMGVPWVVSQGALYIIGAAIYVARVPERFHPGYYDIWGSSHQIFHTFVLAAAAVHFVGLVKAFDFHQTGDVLRVCESSQ